MLRYGIISELGSGDWLGYARVYWDELEMNSYWLPLPCSGGWSSFKINTEVSVLMHPDGEQGQILDKVWNDDDPPPSFAGPNTTGYEFEDGTQIYYNETEHKLHVQLCSGGKIITNAKNQSVNAMLTVLKNTEISEPGNGSPSALQAALKLAVETTDQTIYES